MAGKSKSDSKQTSNRTKAEEKGQTSLPDSGNTGATKPVTASDADQASPTGGANVAGTPQSQLAITQQTDPSGSNIPAPNLRQPPAEGNLNTGAPRTTEESLDPALMDPDKAAIERVEGRTSDAANRSADVQVDDVPPDLNDGPKQSDAGPVQYPFPPGGDVDIATVDPGSGKGEFLAPLEVDDWVVLGEHVSVPDRLVGRRAVVLDAPRYLIPQDRRDDVFITVRTRDEVNATLSIPLSAVDEVQKGGLAVTHRG